MTYHDYYLSVPSEADMPEIPEGATLGVIGQWFDYDHENDTTTERAGWHFNVRSVEPIEWPAIVKQANPVSPWRIFA